MLVGDVFGRNANIEAQIQRRVHFERRLFALQFLHGFFQQPQIRVEADGGDVAVLLAAQQIARAAQFQIERGDLESRAQIGKFAQRGQALAGDLAQFGVGGTSKYAYARRFDRPTRPRS